jgi:hypothetical protein
MLRGLPSTAFEDLKVKDNSHLLFIYSRSYFIYHSCGRWVVKVTAKLLTLVISIRVFIKVDAVYSNVVTVYKLAQTRCFNNRYILNVEVTSIETFCRYLLKCFLFSNRKHLAVYTYHSSWRLPDIGLASLSKDMTGSIA